MSLQGECSVQCASLVLVVRFFTCMSQGVEREQTEAVMAARTVILRPASTVHFLSRACDRLRRLLCLLRFLV
jgi:hypothetical protein